MGIEQIRMNQTKALPPVPQFNWSQRESGSDNGLPKLPVSHSSGSIEVECHNR